MENERIFKSVIMQLNLNYVNLEDKLELIINSDATIKVKTKKMVKTLAKLVIVEQSINTFANMMTNQGIQPMIKKINKKKQNGKI
jgi:hypothetical protein